MGWIGLLVLAWSGPACAGVTEELREAQVHLEARRWRLAEAGFRQVLLTRPHAPQARIGLGRALAATHRCGEALEVLGSVRHTRAWGVPASLAEGTCLEQRGDLAAAVEVYAYATERAPWHGFAWLALARVRAAVGDEAGFEAAVARLELCESGVELGMLARAEAALRWGRPDVDAWVGLTRRSMGDGAVLAVVDARYWLDLGDPARAEAVLWRAQRQMPGGGSLALWRAEALRRLGRWPEAQGILQREDLEEAGSGPLAVALRVRVLADAGRLGEAEAELERLQDPVAPEALASRWYLARARGDVGEVARLGQLWRRCEPSPLRTLDQLVPWTAAGAMEGE